MTTDDAAGQAATDTPVDDGPELTTQNAERAGDNPDGEPQADAVDEVKAETKAKKAAPRKRAAKKAAATRAANVETPEELRVEHRTATAGAATKKDAIVHVYDFENGYGAKVFLRPGESDWTWAPTRDGNVIRNIPGLGRVPQRTSIENINAGLATVASLPSE